MIQKKQNYTVAKQVRLISPPRTRKIAANRIAISSKGKIQMIHIDQILYFRSDSNYTHIYLADGQHLIASMTLKLFEDHLHPNHFIRVHNQYLVHQAYISIYLQQSNRIVLADQTQIPVSRNKKSSVLAFFKTYLIQSS